MKISCDIFIYVDDLRVTGPTQGKALRACCQATSILRNLGIQDAARKRRDSSRMTGAWAESAVYSTEDDLLVLVMEQKWVKAKSQVMELEIIVTHKTAKRKRLQEIRGFLNYIATTYPLILSYLMGIYLTIDRWRKGRDEFGWRRRVTDSWEECEEDLFPHDKSNIEEEGPSDVIIKPRMKRDVQALKEMLKGDKPPLRRVRSKTMSHVYYGFGDASGSAFGATLSDNRTLHYEYGQWCDLDSEESSN